MERSIPIVVVGYNRPKALQRLLDSLLKAHYPDQVELIISIDGGGDEENKKMASSFSWPFGKKQLIIHDENIGLRKHVISCGNLVKDYDGVIVLEDDLYVSPDFYEYTLKAFDFYKDEEKIAGISLYSHAYNETAQFPFRPLTDGSDVFFLQYAPSLGQFWSREGWTRFREWYDSLVPGDPLPARLPPNIKLWPETSWKKYFIAYILQKDLYFAYPRCSFTTHFSDEGTNMRVKENLFQVPLWLDKKEFHLKAFADSFAVYDVFCEMKAAALKRLAPALADYDFDTDLYGMKSKDDTGAGYFLSSRHCKNPVMQFGREMRPHEMNIVAGVEGAYFSLGKKEDFEEKAFLHRLLKCHEKNELAYWYPIREYHFHKNRLLTTNKTSTFFLNPVFLFRKFVVMLRYTYRYFGKN